MDYACFAMDSTTRGSNEGGKPDSRHKDRAYSSGVSVASERALRSWQSIWHVRALRVTHVRVGRARTVMGPKKRILELKTLRSDVEVNRYHGWDGDPIPVIPLRAETMTVN